MRLTRKCRKSTATKQLNSLFNLSRPATMLAISAVLLPCLANADDLNSANGNTQPSTLSAGPQAQELKTITVTARKTEESAKDVPFAMTVISGDDQENRRFYSLEEALRSTPGVDVNSWGGFNDTNIRIRGVGSMYQFNADDSSVVLNIDGVPLSASNASLAILDIEQTEILKGPQGTLFGKNSEAGAINITTRRPTQKTEGYIRGEVGQQGQFMVESAAGGALLKQLSGRFAIRYNGSDNWIENSQTGAPLTKPRDLTFRGSLLWDITPKTSALLIAEKQEMQGKAGLTLLRPYGNTPGNDLTPGMFDTNKKTIERYSVEVNHDFNSSRVTSISAFTFMDFSGKKAYDKKLMQALYGYPMEYPAADFSTEHNFNQDLRWSSLAHARIFWVTGLNYSRSSRSFDSSDYVTGNSSGRTFKTNSFAVYGETTYPLTTDLKITGGVRYTWDKKDYQGGYTSAGVLTRENRELSDNYATGRVALSYALTPAFNLYGVASRGYKSGGFNDWATQVADSVPTKAAVINSFEAGFKSESANRTITLNGAAFFNMVKDDHLMGYDVSTMATKAVNADTESKGVELEGSWKVGYGFTLSGGLTYIDGKITSDARGVSGGDVSSGNRIPDIPEWSGSLSAGYSKALPGFWGLPAPMLNTLVSCRFTGNRAADPQNHFDLGDYQKLDMRIGLATGRTEVYVWADNLLDQQYDLFGYYFAPSVTGGLPARGRTFGVGASFFF